MANITRRAAKKLANYLDDGERVEHAALFEPKGTYGVGAFALATAPRAAGRALERRATADNRESGGLAALFPGKAFVIARTDRRFVVCESNGLAFSAPVLSLELEQIKLAESKWRILGHRIVLSINDTSALSVDAQAGQPIKKMFESLTITT